MSVRRVQVVGIGAGSPEHLTQQAIAALNEVDVFLVAEKRSATDELVALRKAICERFIDPAHPYRFVTVPDPTRGVDADRADAAYGEAVRDWHAARADRYADTIDALPEGAVVGFLVWGDPAFYDSTIRVVRSIGERTALSVDVIPGISAFQALAAAHGIVLHEIGEPVHITTGRRLVAEWAPGLGTVVVMLDGHLTCRDLVPRAPDLQIHWGAYVGMPQQELRAGRLADVIDEITSLRAALRERHGWVMDVYALTSPR
ncbi:precorrin-6A synthase (deacetylating) [Allobranchiibius sp. GilTou73]|uniref:precorrin-6A synthase (deacetylating) n=1 Tax=Allobranchiibius sp. GilTou73 TaxID=2904523 RepID=UPI001F158E97|nr:precorrin-6A synthase (deacetylating) [Allobranchiibius sp. GilTou73]UIJ35189.1 precorrin-6A synthase (deacetylating) [Allobranchiibius sp. GilTou73]